MKNWKDEILVGLKPQGFFKDMEKLTILSFGTESTKIHIEQAIKKATE
jgi:hypothetical protein